MHSSSSSVRPAHDLHHWLYSRALSTSHLSHRDVMVALQIINQFIYPLLYVSNAVVFLSSIVIIGLGASQASALLNS